MVSDFGLCEIYYEILLWPVYMIFQDFNHLNIVNRSYREIALYKFFIIIVIKGFYVVVEDSRECCGFSTVVVLVDVSCCLHCCYRYHYLCHTRLAK